MAAGRSRTGPPIERRRPPRPTRGYAPVHVAVLYACQAFAAGERRHRTSTPGEISDARTCRRPSSGRWRCRAGSHRILHTATVVLPYKRLQRTSSGGSYRLAARSSRSAAVSSDATWASPKTATTAMWARHARRPNASSNAATKASSEARARTSRSTRFRPPDRAAGRLPTVDVPAIQPPSGAWWRDEASVPGPDEATHQMPPSCGVGTDRSRRVGGGGHRRLAR